MTAPNPAPRAAELYWIVFDGEANAFRCTRCGEKAAVALPLRVGTFCAFSAAFETLHKDCADPTPTVPVTP